ncbi:hypothetical protein ACRC7T_06500 [Segnochrobactraceae bacterium EtOH-i3]
MSVAGFYVTAVDGARTFWMRGPFASHEAALAAVDETFRTASGLDPRAHFMGWGTARLELPDGRVLPGGRMNRVFQETA